MDIDRNGSVTSPRGFLAAAVACGMKESGQPDLALVVSQGECQAAGTFTRNQVAAAPVLVSKDTLAAHAHHIRGVVINAGVANACTGEQGLQAARATQQAAARLLGCAPQQILVLSTGVIGPQLDMAKMNAGLGDAVPQLSPAGGPAAARAIMTTDTRPKHAALQAKLPGGAIILGGMAKGAGMIHPHMATMLAVLTTDAALPAARLAPLLQRAVARSFNRITIDGDTSTNDAVLLLANGASGAAVATPADEAAFYAALEGLCLHLAHELVRDGEGASKFVAITVSGARGEEEALLIARTIATSPLVKTALAGGDPNWGRVLAAAGRAGPTLDPARLALWIGAGQNADLQLVAGGEPLPHDPAQAAANFAAPEVAIRLDLGLGEAAATAWTCDLTHGYVTINAEYHT